MPSYPTALLLAAPLGEYTMAFLLGAIYLLALLLVYVGPWLLLLGVGIFLIRHLTREDAPATPPQAANTAVEEPFAQKRQAAPSVPFLQRLKSDIEALAAVITLLAYSVLDLFRWLARQWRRRF